MGHSHHHISCALSLSHLMRTLPQKRPTFTGSFAENDLQLIYISCALSPSNDTEWRRPIGCLKLHISPRKRATNYRAFLWKMTCKEKAFYGVSPPCNNSREHSDICTHTHTHTLSHLYTHTHSLILVHTCTHTHTHSHLYTHTHTRTIIMC